MSENIKATKEFIEAFELKPTKCIHDYGDKCGMLLSSTYLNSCPNTECFYPQDIILTPSIREDLIDIITQIGYYLDTWQRDNKYCYSLYGLGGLGEYTFVALTKSEALQLLLFYLVKAGSIDRETVQKVFSEEGI